MGLSARWRAPAIGCHLPVSCHDCARLPDTCGRRHERQSGLVLMLGTNDVMAPLNLAGSSIADNLIRMARLAKKRCGADTKVVFLSPPPLAPHGISDLCATGYGSADILGQNLAHDFKLAALEEGFLFLDGSKALAHMDAMDGYHMSQEGHRALGELLGHFLASLQ